MKASIISQPGTIETRQLPDPRPDEGEVLIRVLASGICGTDVHIYRGEYLGGYPVTPGHEFAGVVEAVGRSVTRYKAGDRVAVEPNIACDNCFYCLNNQQNFCLNWQGIGVSRPGGMAGLVTAPEKAVFDIGDLPFETGAFMEPLSCVLHGLTRLEAGIGARIAILGAGPIGLLLLQALRLQAASDITVADLNPARAAFAEELGASHILTSLDELERDGYDIVVDASGAIPAMSRTIEFARPGGKILLFGVPPAGKPMSIEPFQVFRKGLTILSSYTSVRNSYQALALLRSGGIDVTRLVSHRLPLEQLESGIHIIEDGREDVRKILILPNS